MNTKGRRSLIAGFAAVFLVLGVAISDLVPARSGQKHVPAGPPLCSAPQPPGPAEIAQITARMARPEDVEVSVLEDVAIVLEYSSIYAVHTPLNPDLPIRSQGGGFLMDFILPDIAKKVDTSKYDFVLLYTIGEVPGWIHSGSRNTLVLAKNIGLQNQYYGQGAINLAWRKLKAAPHMNAISLLKRDAGTVPRAASTLTAAHEMSHQWNVFWAQPSPGPRGWNSTMPIAWLAAASSHWSYVWQPGSQAGIMYSGALSPFFTAFDLYAMGLMGYAEASQFTYKVHEDILPPPANPKLYDVKLDDLIFSLKQAGPAYYEGNGHRVPDTDASSKDLTTLIVVVKGRDEVLTDEHKSLLMDLVTNLPGDWNVATDHRSTMKVAIIPKP